jgi:hypothetical protein
MTTAPGPYRDTASPIQGERGPGYRCGFLPIKRKTLLPRRAIARGGPVPELVRAGRWALPVWLLLVASATPDKAIVDIHWYRSFASRCLGLEDDGSSRAGSKLRSMVARVLAKLVDLKMITVEEKHHKQLLVHLRALDGSGNPYAMPRRMDKVVEVPTGPLFENGWHRKLDQVELAGLLIALSEECWQFSKVGPHQWEKSRDDIARDYGLAASTWSKAKEGLLEAGLLKWDLAPIPEGSRLERVPRDRYTIDAETLNLSAENAPRYANISTPVTVTAPRTGYKLRLERQERVVLPPPVYQSGADPAPKEGYLEKRSGI